MNNSFTHPSYHIKHRNIGVRQFPIFQRILLQSGRKSAIKNKHSTCSFHSECYSKQAIKPLGQYLIVAAEHMRILNNSCNNMIAKEMLDHPSSTTAVSMAVHIPPGPSALTYNTNT